MKVLVEIIVWVMAFAGYFQHLVTTWANDQLGLFILGLIIFPVGVIHGWLIWLGVAG